MSIVGDRELLLELLAKRLLPLVAAIERSLVIQTPTLE